MPTYYTPPQSPTRRSSASFRSSSGPNSHYSSRPGSSRSSSRSRSRSRSRPPRSKHGKETEEKVKDGIPYLFLGSIAAASLLAHKYWPKGFLHGDKADWELPAEHARHDKQKRLAEQQGARGGRREGEGRSRRDVSAAPGSDDGYEGRRHGPWEGRRGVGPERYLTAGDGGDGHSEPGRDRGGWAARPPSSTTGSSGSRASRDPSLDRRPTRNQRTEYLTTNDWYYPPAPRRHRSVAGPRYPLERSTSSAGVRFPSPSGRRGSDYDDHLSDVAYVYRETRPRSRRASFDAGNVSRLPQERYYESYERYR